MTVAAKVRIFTSTTSLGGTHSLIEHRGFVGNDQKMAPLNLLCVFIGI